ncbi:MAG: hypothetical protein U0324_46605 [Polyangiales bacterium]
MTRAAALAAALLLVASPTSAQPAPASAPPAPLDAVVAVLESEADPAPRFVLRSDFVLALRVELVTRGAPDALHVAVDPEYVSAPVLEGLCAEVLVARDAERAALGEADADALATERSTLVERLGGETGLRDLLEATGASRGEFDALVRRRAVARRFLVQRQPRLIVPTTRDLRVRWEEERRRDPAATPETFAAARQPLNDRMIAEAYPRALRQYLRALGGRVRVRYPGGGAASP